MGDTTGNVTYFVIDTTTNTVVGHGRYFPTPSRQNTSVSLTVKVPNASASYQIGTFDEDGFHASSFLSVRNPTSNQRPPGPSDEQDDGPLTCSFR